MVDNTEIRRIFYCPSWDYLAIAQTNIDTYKNKEEYYKKYGIGHFIESDALVSIIFSILSLEARLNNIWIAVYEGRVQIQNKDKWSEIDKPNRWCKLEAWRRINFLNYSVNGRPFFEEKQPSRCHDLLKDIINLRNCITHSVPDIIEEKREIIERRNLTKSMVSTISRTISEKKEKPVGRQRYENLSMKISKWDDIKDINKTHAIEVFKIILAIMYKICQEFKSPPSSGDGLFINKKLVNFKKAFLHYEGLLQSDFDREIKNFFFKIV
jgi:hypothetical protein